MRLSAIVAVICLSAGGLSAAENVHAAVRKHTNIPAQALASALHTLAKARDFQLIYVSEDVSDLRTSGAVGELTSEEALRQLLSGTGLVFRYLDAKTVTIVPAAGSVSSATGGSSVPPLVAAFASGVDASADGQVGGGGQNVQDQDEGIRPDKGRNPDALIEEIVVTGSNIRGVGAVGAASITFTQDELAKTGYSTLGELLASLPQNVNEISPTGALAEGTSRVATSNFHGATGVSLRGLGPGSTLVLLNGKRRPGNVQGQAFDVSAVPLSMIERVEVLTGGRSGIYGSDAVAGVVNIVTVRELHGAESQVYYGESSAGGERFSFSQTLGRTFDDGGFVLGYTYRKDRPLDITDAGVVRAPSIDGVTPIPGLFYLRPASEQHVGLLSGHYELSQNAELYADVHLSSDTNDVLVAYHLLDLLDFGSLTVTEANQSSAAGGIRLDAGENWRIDLSGLYGVVDTVSETAFVTLPYGGLTEVDFPLGTVNDDKGTLTSISAIADGPVGKLWDGTASVAIGIEFRNESYERTRAALPAPPTPEENLERDIWSAFVEMHVPLIDDGVQRLEMSVAGRYDHYSNVGGTFNPQFGVEWGPIGGLSFRGSYATAFRAPDLVTLATRTFVLAQIVDDPLASDGTAALLTEVGGNPGLQPEEADTWTVGVDWEPSKGTKLSLSYFSIDYRNRIGVPRQQHSSVLGEELFYPGLINRNPSSQQLDAVLDRLRQNSDFINRTTIPFDPATDDLFATFPNLVLFDNRRHNIALETIEGLDLETSAVLEARSGDWLFGVNGTYYFDYVRRTTVASPPAGQLNQPGRPVDLRLRGRVGWSSDAWSVSTYINYVDNYVDTLAAPPTEIDSWTTVDLTVSYDVPASADTGFLNGLEATLGVNNVFDEDPPVFLSNDFAIGYDSANADAIGRFVSLRVSKRW